MRPWGNYPARAGGRMGEAQGAAFWRDAARYAAAGGDAGFVGEVAYVMVTLHRTGA